MTVRPSPAPGMQAAFRAAPAPLRLSGAAALDATVADVHAHLQQIYATTRYDRLVYVEQMALARPNTVPTACAPLDCTDTARLTRGGHCAALAQLLVDALPPAHQAFVAGGTLPPIMQQKGAPALCHAAMVIGFVVAAAAAADGAGEEASGHIVVDVGFGFAKPVVVFHDRPTVLHDSDGASDTFTFDKASRTIICQPKELPGDAPWKPKKLRQYQRHYRTDVFANVHAALTTPLARVDKRLPVQARDAQGQEIAAIVVDCHSRHVMQRLHGQRVSDLTFAQIESQGASTPWVDGEVAKALAQSPEALSRRVQAVVADADTRLGTSASKTDA